MIVNIKRDEDGMPEWAIIELQGDLTFEGKPTTSPIGHLHFTKSGTPIFIIGIHVLYGKEMKLTKPFVVLEKKYGTSNEEINADNSKPNLEYIIKAIVKKKLIFKSRPKPIITNVPKTI